MEWRRIDLHIHTPGSNDYQEPDISCLDILRKAEAEELDIIAFTDHNTIAGYAAMQREIADLARWEEQGRLTPEEKKRLEEYRRLVEKILVLPGFELTATFGFHILAIFDKDTSVRTLEQLLLQLNVPIASLDAGETEVGATSDVLTAYRLMAQADALVIAAHANSSHGVAMMNVGFGGQTRIAYTQDPNLHALEVTDLESRRRRTTASFFNGSKPEYPRRMHCIQGSDAHRISGKGKNLGVGERKAEALLSEVSLEALKELFLGNDFTRTRPYRRTTEPYDHVAAARKQGPTIVQSFHESMTRRGGRLHAILRDVVAYANTNGGTIYVGVSPNRKVSPKGLDNPEAAMNELRAGIERQVTPPIAPNLSVLKSQGKNIVRVIVPKGDDPPYVLEGSSIYLRQEAETGLAMRDEIVALIERALAAKKKVPLRRKPAAEKPEQPKQRRQPKPSRQQQRKQPQQPRQAKQQAEQLPVSVEPAAGVGPPHTGVEIVESVERKSVMHHTMRDLRDGAEVRNVTRTSARRLWRYAIALKEKGTFDEIKVTWTGDLGLWHKYLRAGHSHYDLVQRTPGGEIRVYYGVSEDGIYGFWKAVVGMKE